MLYHWMKIFLAGSVYLFLKKRWLSLLLVTASTSFFLIGHSEYLAYKTATSDVSNIGLSYLVKWLGIITTFAIYLLYVSRNHWFTARRNTHQAQLDRNQNRKQPVPAEPQHDGFDAIRAKKVLRKKAQQIIDSKANDINH